MSQEKRRAVVITGAAGGLGQQLLKTFSKSGDLIIGLDYNAQIEEISKEFGAVGMQVDIRNEASVRTALNAVGTVDVLVNNAAVLDRLGNATELELEEYDQVMGVNARGALICSRAVLPGMLEVGRGAIVNVASIAGLSGGRAGSAYTMSKWAMVGLTKNLAASLGPQGIRTNAVAPGGIETPMGVTSIYDSVFPSAQKLLTRDRDKPAPATPQEIADVVYFLASNAASQINGAVIPVDGGSTAY